MRYLPTGISSLDRHLRGGVRVGTITELVGKAGVGKTQLAMQLCVMAARYGQGCVYIDTEQKLSLDRMREIASKRASTFNAVPPPLSNGDSLEGAFSYVGRRITKWFSTRR
jgi:RecA/RadA recombinase